MNPTPRGAKAFIWQICRDIAEALELRKIQQCSSVHFEKTWNVFLAGSCCMWLYWLCCSLVVTLQTILFSSCFLKLRKSIIHTSPANIRKMKQEGKIKILQTFAATVVMHTIMKKGGKRVSPQLCTYYYYLPYWRKHQLWFLCQRFKIIHSSSYKIHYLQSKYS